MFHVFASLLPLPLPLSLSLSLALSPSTALSSTLGWLAFADGAPSAAPGAAPPGAAPTTVVPFRTDAAPRIDPVFGDVTSLRAAIDRFLSLQGEMDRVRDECSSAVHATLATLTTTAASKLEGRACPPAAAAPYARALAAGGRYLALGQQLQTAYREIRRGDELGDAAGLTPDYRLKVKKARELHQQLLSDYREMRVAFYDQLGAEMRHAGCRPPARGATASAPDVANPVDPDAWDLGEEAAATEPGDSPPSLAKAAAPRMAPGAAAARAGVAIPAAAEAAPAAGAAPAIWIEVDNTLCNEPTHLSVDGQVLGDIGARNRTSVRARSGPHEVCALPASDRRACGEAGTLRKAYLHEGWRLTIHCAK